MSSTEACPRWGPEEAPDCIAWTEQEQEQEQEQR